LGDMGFTFIIALPLCVGLVPSRVQGDDAMQLLNAKLDNRAFELQPAARQEGEVVWVPAEVFGQAIDAECKDIGGQWAMCRGDLCIPIDAAAARVLDGVLFVRLDAFAEPLGLEWSVADGLLSVSRGQRADGGLGVGQVPPAFALPDLYSGELVSSSDFRGKKTFFYMWASW